MMRTLIQATVHEIACYKNICLLIVTELSRLRFLKKCDTFDIISYKDDINLKKNMSLLNKETCFCLVLILILLLE